MEHKNFITGFGLFSTIVATIVGVGIFSYPRELASKVGTDGWIVTIGAGILIYLLFYISYKAIKVNEYNKFNIILERNFGKIFGGILALGFVAYNVFSISLGMRIFVEVVKMYLLERTPTEFLIIITIFAGIYLVRNEVDALVKFNEVSFWIMFIPIILMLLCALNKTDFTNILPVFRNDAYNYLDALKSAIYSFAGIEIIYLIGPFVKNKSSINKIALKSVIFITLFYVIVVVFVLAIFSKEQTKILLWPTITMINSINIQGAFIERWEGIVMAIWIIFYFTTFSNVYYLSSDIIRDVFKLDDIKLSSAIIAPAIYIVALYPQNIAELYSIGDKFVPVLFLYSVVILPIAILLFGKLRKKSHGSKVASILIICVLLTGCWDKVEIENTELVSIIGIDAGEDIGKRKELKNVKPTDPLTSIDFKKLHVTFGIPDLSKLGPDKGGISGDKYIDVDGYSIQDAISKAILKSSRTVKFSHTKLLVLGQNLMMYPDVVKEVIDYLQREPALNRNMYIVTSDGNSQKYVKFKTSVEKSVEMYILGLIENNSKNSEILPVTLNDFLIQMSENGNSILPKMVVDDDNKNIKVVGTTAIKNFKQNGNLNEVETANIELLRGNLKSGKKMIYINGHPVDITIDNASKRMRMSQEKGKITFYINLDIEGQIKNYYTNDKVLSVDTLGYIEQSFNKAISQECEAVVKVTQKELGIDPVGFREYIEKYHPGVWSQVKSNWENVYKDAVVNVNVDTKIRRIGVVK
ncbi:Ger(x)C family spore germination protein [Clostridium sp. WILCCON 0269]|uniref:Ger(X)C family spore germination protein n=1 Tax=Candidatus Clostridium eludens TaxID=3381663 RepID=A0ABW8SK23_9CLOT